MSQIKKLAGDTALYGVNSILARLINFLLIIVYTGYLDVANNGSITSLYAYLAFFNVIFTYGMETAYFRFASKQNALPLQVYNNAQSLVITTTVLLAGLIYFSADWLSTVLDYPGKAYIFRWMAMILAIDAVLAIPYARLRLERRVKLFVSTKLFNVLLTVLLNLFFIVWLPQITSGSLFPSLQDWALDVYQPAWGMDYAILANLCANAAIIPLLFWVNKGFRYQLDKGLLQEMWKYAYPLLFMGLAGVTNEMLSRGMFEYILPADYYAHLTPREANGVFGACYKLAILMNLGIQAFKYAAEPFFFSQASDKNSPQLFADVMHWFVIVCCFVLFSITINLHWIAPIFLQRPVFLEALDIVPTLLLAYLFLGVYYNLSIWFKLTDKTGYSVWITSIGVVITVALNIALIPILGYQGSALATLACYIGMAIICYLWGQRHLHIPYQTGKDLAYILLTFSVAYLVFTFKINNLWVSIGINALLMLGFLVLVYGLEKKNIKSLTAR